MSFMNEPPDDLEQFICSENEDELEELKLWLINEKKELEEDKKKFHEEMDTLEYSMEMDRKRLQQENIFFDQKMKILQSGFSQLDEDRQKFQKEKDKFDAKNEIYKEHKTFNKQYEITDMLFRGVNSSLALKKRYKDLIKMFHPDNVAGDHDMIQMINREYEELKKDYEIGRQA